MDEWHQGPYTLGGETSGFLQKSCDALDWRRFLFLALELVFLKKLHKTPFYVNQQRFWCILCSEAVEKGKIFSVDLPLVAHVSF